ncbi:MAG TPA: spermidine synthase [Verrucomicrobia bacterium]|nr:MAG: spermidine synthase [Lentisphaerae bacterium GWF2_57_35]HBA82701.1 spermidine synthase [Verrucomicrobiota bacterium]
MKARIEELDRQMTRMGELILRRRLLPALDNQEVYEVKLGEEYLMSSLFHDAEVAMVRLGLERVAQTPLDVVVGGLGLGYTAAAVLDYPGVRSLLVIEALDAVMDWHQRKLVPLGDRLVGDSRSRLIHGDFFAVAGPDGHGFDPELPDRKFHAILLDVDHSPSQWLSPLHAPFYETNGLHRLTAFLHRGGVFALWSNDPPEETFIRKLETVFPQVRAEVVTFPNPLTDSKSANTVYVAKIEG